LHRLENFGGYNLNINLGLVLICRGQARRVPIGLRTKYASPLEELGA
jgi:hypothetical protein